MLSEKVMSRFASDIAFTPAVKALQSLNGSRQGYATRERKGGWATKITPELARFLESLDMFYFGTSNSDGQPYIQYRGGSRGFLKIINESTLGFADFGGNRQFITAGNLRDNPKAFIFLMDYENRQRVKIWGTAKVVDDAPELLEALSDPSYPGKVERAITFEIKAWDINCPQHIHRRISKEKVDRKIQQLQNRIAELEEELASLRAGS
jgi:predicted pyridoxine 5'-phosphate oxidase superfamily flavin-nucleotide-binding protein